MKIVNKSVLLKIKPDFSRTLDEIQLNWTQNVHRLSLSGQNIIFLRSLWQLICYQLIQCYLSIAHTFIMIDLLKIVYELTAGNFSQVSDVTYVPLVIHFVVYETVVHITYLK